MKILLIDVNCKSGSTGKIVYDLHTNLIKDGYESAICYGRGKLIEENHIYKFSSNIEVYFHAFMSRILGLMGYFSYFSTKKLIRYIKQYKPDVVHIHELHSYFVNIIPLIKFLKENNIKTVWTFHCEYMYTGNCGHAFECEKWKHECGKCPDIKRYPTSLFFDFTKKMFKDKKKVFEEFNNLTIVTPSEWLANRVKKSFLKDKKIRVIYNGIDTQNIFYPRDYQSLKKKHNLTDEKVVLAVAPNLFSEEKGGKFILELANKLIDYNIKFIMIGDSSLESKSSNVIIMGKTENQIELAEYYSMANVFVICSKMENFPTVCLEAICCGTYVCGYDVGGVKETAPKGLGKFVPYGNLEELAKIVLSILSEDKNIEKCKKYGHTYYSRERMYEDYKKLYTN